MSELVRGPLRGLSSMPEEHLAAAMNTANFYRAPVHSGHLLDRFVCPLRQHRVHVTFFFSEPFSRTPRLRFMEERPRFRLNGDTRQIEESYRLTWSSKSASEGIPNSTPSY